jgi:hypothetical protein
VSADNQGQGKAEQPTLTHTQCINRLQEIRDAMGQIAELERPSDEDDRYFAELRDEFDKTDRWRKHLEREAELERVRSTANGLTAARGLRTVPGAFGGGSSRRAATATTATRSRTRTASRRGGTRTRGTCRRCGPGAAAVRL